MQNKTPILVLTGLAIVAAAAIAGLTRDRWMAEAPPAQTAGIEEAAETGQPAATTAEQPATTTAEQPAATTAEQSATTTAEQPAATTAEQPATTTAEQPAATTAEQPATTTAEQPAATTAEQPATTAEQPPAVSRDDQAPAFDTVRVETTGEAVIAGTAAPGAEVFVKLDGLEIGKAMANSDGAFVITPDKPLPVGSGALTLESRSPGQAAGTTSKQSVAVIVPAGGQQQPLVAVVSPDQPTKVIQKPQSTTGQPAKLVTIDAVDYDAAGNIVFSGQGDQGHSARVYVDNAMVGDAAVGADGRWSFSATADISTGNHILRVDGLDAEGKVVNRVEVPFFREDQTKVADAIQPSAETGQSDTSMASSSTEAAASTAAGTGSAGTEAASTEAVGTESAGAEAASTEVATSDAASTEASSTEVTVPEATSTAAASQPVPREGRIVIQPGNNLWRISRVLYGTGAKFTVLYDANKDQIRNPDLIYPGQVFRTPDVAPKTETVDPHRREPLKPDENAATGQ
jgi:nucleoid-associated protein YgaU